MTTIDQLHAAVLAIKAELPPSWGVQVSSLGDRLDINLHTHASYQDSLPHFVSLCERHHATPGRVDHLYHSGGLCCTMALTFGIPGVTGTAFFDGPGPGYRLAEPLSAPTPGAAANVALGPCAVPAETTCRPSEEAGGRRVA